MSQKARHILRITISYVVATFAAGMVFSLWASTFLFSSDIPIYERFFGDLATGLMLGGLAVAIAAVPSALAIYIAERRRWRRLTTHLLTGALISLVCALALAPGLLDGDALLLLPVAVCGSVGGFVYWILAGRKAGSSAQRTG